MQLRYKYYLGGDWNPYEEEEREALKRLIVERNLKDPSKEEAGREILPTLNAWPDYVLAASKSTFWQGERDLSRYESWKIVELEDIWAEAKAKRAIGEFIKEVDADEVEKAICYYLALLFCRFAPGNYVVDFRLYFTESAMSYVANEGLETLTPYEG